MLNIDTTMLRHQLSVRVPKKLYDWHTYLNVQILHFISMSIDPVDKVFVVSPLPQELMVRK